jgi:site-specific DNA recombinase
MESARGTKVTAQAEIRTATGHRQLSRDDIAAVVAAFADLAQVVREADPADKAELYAQLKLTLTYQPDQRLVEATVTADGVAAAWWRPGPALAGSGGCSWPR